MAVQGTVISNLDGLVFNKGYMYGTRLPAGATDRIAWGALQNVALAHEFGLVEISGPEALPPLAVGIGSERLTGTFENGVIHPAQYILATGGSETYSAPSTIYTKLVSQEPAPFNLHFESGPNAQDDLDLQLFNCLMPTWNLRGDHRGFMMGSGSFTVFGQAPADGGKLFQLSKPGNITNSS